MAKKARRGRGRLAGGIGYPGDKEVGVHNLPAVQAKDLRENERRLGVSKSALVTFALRNIKLYRFSLKDIEQDIRAAVDEESARQTEKRRKRWKSTLGA